MKVLRHWAPTQLDVRSSFPLRGARFGLVDGRRESSEALARVDGQIGLQRVRFSILDRGERG